MAAKTVTMETIDRLGQKIDDATDEGDEKLLLQFEVECKRLLRVSEGEMRVRLLYSRANVIGGIISAKSKSNDSLWGLELPDHAQNLFLLRQAVVDPAFETADPILKCQIRTNLANRLCGLSRPIAANEQYLRALAICPLFAKALLNLSHSIESVAMSLYDGGHQIVLMAHALTLLRAALDKKAFWESGDRELFVTQMEKRRDWISENLKNAGHDPTFDLNQFSLGETGEERTYRDWCLRERLFLTPLNDVFTESVAARDVFHLPSHSYDIGMSARYADYFNLLKQEYISARYRLFVATNDKAPEFLMREAFMLDGGEDLILGHSTEELRSAYRSAYSIFDKISHFMNEYFEIGIKPRKVQFRHIWFLDRNDSNSQLRPVFEERHHWPLRGLYYLSKDLYDDKLHEVAEPDAAKLNQIRNQLEHRFLSFQHFLAETSRGTLWTVSIEDFQQKTVRLLRLAREALIYVSLAMHHEEQQREEKKSEDGAAILVVHESKPLDSFDET